MKITLEERTEDRVRIYFREAQKEAIRKLLPQKAKTEEEAVADYRNTLLPGASSYGRTIFADGIYVGDIWCYCINPKDTPNAMVSYCIFNTNYWDKDVATEAMKLFLEEIRECFQLRSVGGFTYSENAASIRVMEKNGFQTVEEFLEDGVLSKYCELTFT